MYYYVVDPPKPFQAGRVAQKIQEIIAPLGISGEVAIASPARSAEELAYMGIDKGYSTMVAVGGDDLINTLATIIMNDAKESTALGVIPFGASTFITNLINVGNGNIRAAGEVLKQRNLLPVDLVHISPKRYMLSDAYIVAPKPMRFSLDIDQSCKVEVDATFAHITNELVFTVGTQEKSGGFFSFLRNSAPEFPISTFHGRQIRCVTSEPLSVNLAGTVAAKTPTTFTKIPYALKLITARVKIMANTNQDEQSSQSNQEAR